MRSFTAFAVALIIHAAAGTAPAQAQAPQREPLPAGDPRVALVQPLIESIIAGDAEAAATRAQRSASEAGATALATQARRLAAQFGGNAFELAGFTAPGAGDVRNVLVELRRREDGARRFMLVMLEDGGAAIDAIALPTMRQP